MDKRIKAQFEHTFLELIKSFKRTKYSISSFDLFVIAVSSYRPYNDDLDFDKIVSTITYDKKKSIPRVYEDFGKVDSKTLTQLGDCFDVTLEVLKNYYYRGESVVSDETYDGFEQMVKDLIPNAKAVKKVGSLQIGSEKVQHSKKMLSLNKTYSEMDLIKWINGNTVLSMFKIDGSSCSLVFEDGKLIIAKTRGDGSYGENISSKALFIPGIQSSLSKKNKLSNFEVRGEVYCTEENFLNLSKEMENRSLEKPMSQRNIVSGLLGRKENIDLCKFLSFKAFDIIVDDINLKFEHEKFDLLKSLEFSVPEYTFHNNASTLSKSIDQAKEFISSGDYLIDGLVFVYDSIRLHEELGETSHHPRYKIAFKFSGEAKVTSIVDIEWNVSRNGRLTPVALVAPVELSGAMIGRVTLHNFGLAKNFELKAGDKIEIIRSGEVIPKFLGVAERAPGKFTYPKKCPSCSSDLKIEDIWLYCDNERCPSKMKEEILNYIHKANIEDVSDKRLEELIGKGLVETIPDLYRLNVEDFLILEKVKDKLANKMFENIARTKEQSLTQFISAIGVEGVSTAKAEKIIAQGYNTIDKILALTPEKMIAIEGFAEKSSTEIVASLQKKEKLIRELLSVGVKLKADEINTGEGPLAGMKFCITGELSSPRVEFEKMIKKNGGVMVSSVSKNTTYLITNETDGSSSKFVKAKEIGIPIITEKKLFQMIEG